MTPERWARIEDLFHRVIESEPGERDQLLEAVGKTDPELRGEVEALLAAHKSAGGHLEAALRAGRENAFATSTTDSPEAIRGGGIGPYHLIEQIGEGGMGEVWLTDQKEPVRRRVALKLIKAGMDTREVVKRFESERQALALMDHPAIAKVFDAGSTSYGHPYFVMEYVAGMPITTYCDKHKLTTRERLQLFMHVCEGVQHAHQKAIIHRDLKPSNILVSEVDGTPAPRIIDFGVAKAISQPLTAETMFTRPGAIVGTLGYMSPEQADSAGQDIDTRTDVYSLGVVLYELLVGALPLDFEKLPFDEMLRRLREQDAPRPSTKLRSLRPQSTTTAQNRGTDPPTLARLLRGDLDAITLKALEKHRSRRYGSPSELAADIGRHLRHEPVLARPASTIYRARKYVRRHRIGVVFAAALVLLLAVAAIAQTVQLRRVTRERDRADRITTFMTNMFKVSNPSEARGNKVTAREILDKASTDIETGLANDPQLQAQMIVTMAGTYRGLGLYTRADSLYRHAIEIQKRVLGPEHPETLHSMMDLSGILGAEYHFAEAEKLCRDALAIQRRTLGPRNPATVASMASLARTLTADGQYPEAERFQREILQMRRDTLGPDNPDTLSSMGELALTLDYEEAYLEAERLQWEELAALRRMFGSDSMYTMRSMTNLAQTLVLEGRYEDAAALQEAYPEAERLQREELAALRRMFGSDSMYTMRSMTNLAQTLMLEGRYEDAAALQHEAFELQNRVLGPEHPNTLDSLEMEALCLGRQGRYTEAEKLFRQAIELARDSKQPGVSGLAWYNLACAAATAGRREEALKYLAQSVEEGHAAPRVMAEDPDLKSLHGDPRFDALLVKAHQLAAASGNSR